MWVRVQMRSRWDQKAILTLQFFVIAVGGVGGDSGPHHSLCC